MRHAKNLALLLFLLGSALSLSLVLRERGENRKTVADPNNNVRHDRREAVSNPERPAVRSGVGDLAVPDDPVPEFPMAEVLAERVVPQPDGRFERQRLLRVSGPFRNVRVVEHYRHEPDGGVRRENIEAMLADSILVVRPDDLTIEQFATELAEQGLRAGPQYVFSPAVRVFVPEPFALDSVPEAVGRVGTTRPRWGASPDFLHFSQDIPNDYDAKALWGLERMRAPLAWTQTTGAAELIAGVIDSGVDASHPDLAGNTWSNASEMANGRDDDGNGLVDDLKGWDFADNDSDPSDEHGHGTHVAGIIGARGNNALGITGVAWRVRLLGLRCGNEYLATSSVIQALDYLGNLRHRGEPVVVANNSYGSTTSVSTQRDSIQRAAQRGILFVAAAGNDARDVDGVIRTYPVSYGVDNIVGVAATNLADGLADYSNWGQSSVLLAAPGSAILSAKSGGGYVVMEGTSMAAPFVTGAVILMKAAEPSLDYLGIKNRLYARAVPRSLLTGKVLTGGMLDLGALIAPAEGVAGVEWVSPRAGVIAVEPTLGSVELTARGYQILAGEEVGSLPVGWAKVTGPGNATFTAAGTPGAVRAEFTAAGIYQLRATAGSGAAAASVEKTVIVGDGKVSTDGLLARWTFGGEGGVATDQSGQGRDAALVGGASVDAGPFDLAALRCNGTTAGAAFSAPAPAKVTLAGWINLDSAGNSVFPRMLHFPSYYLFAGCATSGAADGNRGTVKFLANWSGNDGVYHTAPDLLSYRSWHHFAATYDSTLGENHLPALFLDGRPLVVAAQSGAMGVPEQVVGEGYLGSNSERSRALDGRLADVRIYGRELSAAEVAALAAGPAIESMLGWRLVVAAAAPNAAVLQLRKEDGRVPDASQLVGWVRIEGPGSAAFGTTAGGQADVAVPTPGLYSVTISLNEGGATMERRFQLELPGESAPVVPPGFLREPVGRTLAVGGMLRLECIPTGTPPLSYQWSKDGSPIPGAVAQDLVIAGAKLVDTGKYSVRIGNAAGTATSAEAEVIVLEPPSITQQPVARTVAIGANVELSVQAAGSPPLLYQWRRNGSDLPGGTEPRLVLQNVTGNQGGAYTVMVSNLVGSVVSAPAAIEVLEPPSFLTQPKSQTVVAGSTLQFEVTVRGAVPWTFQWYKDGRPITGATDPSLRFVVAKESDSGEYTIRVSNSVGEALSQPFTLRVLEKPKITQQLASKVGQLGERLVLEVVATGSAPLTYKWYHGYTVMAGQTGPQYVIERLQRSDEGAYKVQISNEVGSVTSSVAYVELLSPPQILRMPEDQAVSQGALVTLTVQPDGQVSSYGYRWTRNGQVVPGATGNQLRIDSVQPDNAGLYVAEISSIGGTTTTSPAVVGVRPTGRTAGAVETRPEWQGIVHPNGNIYDQFLLTGAAGTITAEAGKIARLSFLDEDSDIVQVELSGAGAVTVCLAEASGPQAPLLYNQTGINYYQGKPTVVLVGADASTHMSIYSVGRLNNPGVTLPDIPYDGWADVRALGVVSADKALGGLYLGNVAFGAGAGPVGIVATTVRSVGTVRLHDVAATGDGWPHLRFAADGRVQVAIAGGSLAQDNGRPVDVPGVQAVLMGAGSGSSGQSAPAQAIRGRLVRDGVDVTATIVVPAP